ncbi:hypothetical protein D3C75_680770 [compost metagenome]
MVIFLRGLDDIVIELIDPPCARETLELADLMKIMLHVTTLQDDHVGLLALQLDQSWRVVIDPPLDPAGTLQLDERLHDPIMPDSVGVAWQGQYRRHGSRNEWVPTSAQARLEIEISQLQAEVAVIGGVPGTPGQPTLVEQVTIRSLGVPVQCGHILTGDHDNFRERRPNRQEALLTCTQAQIGIKVRLAQVGCIQPVEVSEQLTPNHQAIKAQCCPVLNQTQAAHVTLGIHRTTDEWAADATVESEHQPRTKHTTVTGEQFRPH